MSKLYRQHEVDAVRETYQELFPEAVAISHNEQNARKGSRSSVIGSDGVTYNVMSYTTFKNKENNDVRALYWCFEDE